MEISEEMMKKATQILADADLAETVTGAAEIIASALQAQDQEARKSIDELEAEVAKQRRRATDAEHLNVAYRNMLGPNGRAVAEMWREKGVTRVHFDWGPAISDMTGEEVAQFILGFEGAQKKPLDFAD